MPEDPLTTVPADPGLDPVLCLADTVHARLVSIAGWLGLKPANIESHPIDPFEDGRDLPGLATFIGDVSEPFDAHLPAASPNAQAEILIEVFVKGGSGWAGELRPLMSKVRQGVLRYHGLVPSGLVPRGLTERHDMATSGKQRAVRGLITLTFAYQAYYPPVIPDTLESVVVELPEPDGTPKTIANLTPADCES